MNITYILGAGASFNALPIVNKINDRLYEFRDVLSNQPYVSGYEDFFRTSYNHAVEEDGPLIKDILNEFVDSINWLIEENSKHSSIDTFAKKLYLQNDVINLHRLKIILSCFFVFLQNEKFDNRYDSFFASILDDLTLLPSNLKIISWNYDYQLEIAFSNFIKNKRLSDNQRVLNVCAKGIKVPDRNLVDKFGIFKINGTTTLMNNLNPINIMDNLNDDKNKLLREIASYYYYSTKKNKMPTTLSFAWEENSNQFINSVANCVKNTDILIVIGYSFPFFNRKVDKQILKSMPKLSRIYIQDPNSEAITERIESLLPQTVNNINKYQIKMIDQFYIPFEY